MVDIKHPKYEFPIIRDINDVLPHISGKPEFKVVEKGKYTFINYLLANETTFPCDDSLTSRILRECRGITFYTSNGVIASRPFHKFFNVNEREDTKLSDKDITNVKIQSKVDGSMLRPLLDENGEIRFATKMGFTDIANEATEYARRYFNLGIFTWLAAELYSGKTVLFEYYSPSSRVVLSYGDVPKFFYLSTRDNITGSYFFPKEDIGYYDNIITPIIPIHFNAYGGISNIRTMEDIEGFIIHKKNGDFVKIKTDWYVKFHKMKDLISKEKTLVSLILDDKVDDILSFLGDEDKECISTYQKEFHKNIIDISVKIAYIVNIHKTKNYTKKQFATEIVPAYDKRYQSLLFKCWDNPEEDLIGYIKNIIRKNCTTSSNLEKVRFIFPDAKYRKDYMLNDDDDADKNNNRNGEYS